MSSKHKFGKQRAEQDRAFESLSIWGHEGNPALAEDAQKDAMNAQGEDLKDPFEFKSESYKRNYEEGKKMYKDEKMTQLLKGEIGSDELDTLDVDRIFGRSSSTTVTSPGGIIVKP